MTPMQRMHAEITCFIEKLVGLPIPSKPTPLSSAREQWAINALEEELQELKDAETLEDQADALLDLVYFALGRVTEMGFPPGVLFDEIHEKNMAKQRGELSKRPGSLGYDAIKPDGWTPPDLAQYLNLTREDLRKVFKGEQPFTPKNMPKAPALADDEVAPKWDSMDKPKVVIIGHARHGKDTLAEILRDSYGYEFQSSSRVCAEVVIRAILTEPYLQTAFLSAMPDDKVNHLLVAIREMNERYADGNFDVDELFEGRGSFRHFWYEAIAWYNDQPTRLAKEIFAVADLYVGVRHKRELNGIRNEGLANIIVWVDASDRLPQEPCSSISVEPWMADFVIDNNGSEQAFIANIHAFAKAHLA